MSSKKRKATSQQVDNNNANLSNQMEELMSIMMNNDNNQATTTLDTKVNQILTNIGAVVPPKTHNNDKDDIEEDMGNYDDDDDENDESKEKQQQQNDTPSTKQVPPPIHNDNHSKDYETIPLGKQGAQMMTTFGDGPNPHFESVQRALLGTRKSLQIAIMDARALRRHDQIQFLNARNTLKQRRKKASNETQDPNMIFKAYVGYHKLAYNPKCGFDFEQLQKLFPEEMRSYMRWVDMHDSSQQEDEEERQESLLQMHGEDGDGGDDEDDNNNNKKKKRKDSTDNSNDNTNDIDNNGDDSDEMDKDDLAPITEGHLHERAATFDVRTNKMEEDWYLKFSKVRQGSFLSRRAVGRRGPQADIQWDARRNSKRGKGKHNRGGNWESLSATSVRFLHWLGFDPNEVPPPDDPTTQALAFLGYDFMGKIVEKAIFLRNLKRRRKQQGKKQKQQQQQQQKTVSSSLSLSELVPGEQLTVHDIEQALKAPDVCPTPLYHNPASATSFGGNKAKVSTQLYFGPGFEERLEAEINAMTGSKDAPLTEEERKQRDEDAMLLKRMSERPAMLDCIEHLIRVGNDDATVAAQKKNLGGNNKDDENGDDDDADATKDNDDDESGEVKKNDERLKADQVEGV